ncbi:MAG: heme-copper oxidase subunit III [Candidatus Eremiobacteraeota bacterium]|nr:heme-copper oxidase subunit III [Candidatus Eremiobacteraeota bacterium]MBV9407495.1 heme-copper oxidase subunit III [Candidatus Eremiobacteraeota bacterium]
MRSVAVRAHPLVFGVVVFLASESMLFAGLLAAWYDLRGMSAAWPPPGAHLDLAGGTVGTVLLGLGSVTMGIAQVAATRRRRGVARAMLVLTLFCALAFVYVALRGWSQANFAVDTDAFGTLFFVLTGTHLAHVIAGAILLTALAVFLRTPAFTRDDHAGVEAIAYYWHFVFVVWLAIYATVYLVR